MSFISKMSKNQKISFYGIFGFFILTGLIFFGVFDTVLITAAYGASHLGISPSQMSETERLMIGLNTDERILEELDKQVVLPDRPFEYFIKRLGEDVSELFTFDDEEKARLKLLHAEERAREIRILTDQNRMVQQELVDNLKTRVRDADILIQRIETTPAEDPALRRMLVERLEQSFSLQEATVIRAEFQQIRFAESNQQERLASELDRKLNDRIEIKILCLGGIDTLSIARSPEPVDELQEECPPLKIFPEDEIRKLLQLDIDEEEVQLIRERILSERNTMEMTVINLGDR